MGRCPEIAAVMSVGGDPTGTRIGISVRNDAWMRIHVVMQPVGFRCGT